MGTSGDVLLVAQLEPAGQSKHSSAEAAPGVERKLPAAQRIGVLLPSGQYEPGGQSDGCAVALSGQKKPGLQPAEMGSDRATSGSVAGEGEWQGVGRETPIGRRIEPWLRTRAR